MSRGAEPGQSDYARVARLERTSRDGRLERSGPAGTAADGLGAEPRRVKNLIVGDGMRLAACGIVIGLAGSFGATRLMESLLFGVTTREPAVLSAAAVVLCLVALLAVWLPARHASRVNAALALRTESP